MNLARDLKMRSGFASLDEELMLTLARATAELSGPRYQLFKSVGLSEATYNVLRILRGAHREPVEGERSLACAQIIERMVTRVPDLTRLLDRLESAGLVTRERSSADRRVVRTSISRKGLALLAELDEPVLVTHAEATARLDAREKKTLIDLLNRLRRPDEA